MTRTLIFLLLPFLFLGFGCKKETPAYQTQSPIPQTNEQKEITQEEQLAKEVSIYIEPQKIGATNLIFSKVTSPQDGWLAVYKLTNGQPSLSPTAFVAISQGDHTNVALSLPSPTKADDTYIAIIHLDTGTTGEFEFPKEDPPLPMKAVVIEVKK